MNKSFYIAVAMFILSSFIIALITSNAVTGIGIGYILAFVTYVFFEYEFFQIKKDWMLRVVSKQSGHNLMNKEFYIDYALKHRR